MKIINFGSCNIDYVYNVSHFVNPGETISSVSRKCFPGGKGLNQSIAIARSGAKVYHAGCIGKDGIFLKKLLESSDVNTDYLKILDMPTGHAIIQVDTNGENSIILYSGANYAIDKVYIDEVLSNFNEGDIIVLQNEISNIDYIIETAYKMKMRIILNPSPFHENLTKLDLNKLSLIILNEVEAKEFSGETITEKIIEYFRSNYETLKVVLTIGAKGSIYVDKESEIFFPSYLVEVADTTSAGDTYTGYFISGMTMNTDIKSVLKTATAAAALAVSKEGAAVSIPCINEVNSAMNTLKLNNYYDYQAESKKTDIEKYIAENLQHVKLDSVAEILGFSKAYTTVWMKKHMKKSFSDIVKNMRCEKAAHLLKETDMPIEDIIHISGYENGSFFRKLFKEAYGKSLHEYRNFYGKDK